jgi:hypothetical protein
MFLRRKRTPDFSSAIADFWIWWSGAKANVQQVIEAGGAATLAEELNRRVTAIHSDLQWEFARGARSRHALIVSPAGNATVRAAAARWLAEAPGPDETWEYHRARQADPASLSAIFESEGHRLDLDDLQFEFTVDSDRRVVHVTTYHPRFADIPEGLRASITYLGLDWLLGEDAVEIWVGAVEWSTTPIAEPQPRAALAAAVAEMSAPREEPLWTIASGRDPSGAPIIALMQLPLRSARWPQYDTHVAVMLPYRAANDGGLPVGESLDALRRFEDDLTAEVDVHGQLVAHESSNHRRILHYYVDGAGTAVRTIQDRLTSWREGRASAKPSYDPEFVGVRHLS